MLRGSIIYGYANVGPKFSDACLGRMDGGNAWEAPWESELIMAAMALLGVAWLTLVLGLRWRLRTKTVAALPGLATLAVALPGAMAIGDARQAGIAPTDSAMLLEAAPLMLAGVLIIELLAVVALLWILAWQPAARAPASSDRQLCCRVRRPLVPSTYSLRTLIMTRLSRWNLGFGYLTVATITISAILTVIMTLRTSKRAADPVPEVDPRAGSLTIA